MGWLATCCWTERGWAVSLRTMQDPYVPPTVPPPVPPAIESQGDATGGLIPYKNPHALAAYYCGIFSIIPLLGFLLGLISVGLGISGLKKKKRNPLIRGTAHAWVGIVVGGGSVLVHLAIAGLAAWVAHEGG